MKKLLCALVALLATPVVAAGGFDIRGVPLGASRDDVMATLPDASCKPLDEPILGDELCVALDYGNARNAGVVYYLAGGKVESAVVLFNQSDYARIRAAMVLKYGKPKEAKTSEMQNRLGAAFLSEKVIWSSGNEILRLTERAGRIDQSEVKLISSDGMRASKARADASAQSEAAEL